MRRLVVVVAITVFILLLPTGPFIAAIRSLLLSNIPALIRIEIAI